MKYLAICVALHDNTIYTSSRPVAPEDTDEPTYLLSSFAMEIGCDEEDIGSILIVKNGVEDNAPEVIKHWTAGDGDFG